MEEELGVRIVHSMWLVTSSIHQWLTIPAVVTKYPTRTAGQA